MQVAKNFLTFCAIPLLWVNTVVAQHFEGTFSGDNGKVYEFHQSTFKTSTGEIGLHSPQKVAQGNYSITEDTLFLHFKPVNNPPKPGFEFVKKEPIDAKLSSQDRQVYVHFKIVGNDNKPIIPPPIVILKNKEEEDIQGFRADSLGQIPEVFIFGSFQGYFHFTSLANEELKIKTDTLSGYKSRVKVTLPERTRYEDYEGTKKYMIKTREQEKIVLQSLTNDEEIVLERKK